MIMQENGHTLLTNDNSSLNDVVKTLHDNCYNIYIINRIIKMIENINGNWRIAVDVTWIVIEINEIIDDYEIATRCTMAR